MHPEFDLIEPDDAVYAEYSANFVTYNAEAAGAAAKSFSLVHRVDDQIVAGGRGYVFLGALEVRGLWVDAVLRGSGIGSRLLRGIEAEARKRGATKAMLYTYSWQAEAFYLRHGYRVYARFDYPMGHQRIDLEKDL